MTKKEKQYISEWALAEALDKLYRLIHRLHQEADLTVEVLTSEEACPEHQSPGVSWYSDRLGNAPKPSHGSPFSTCCLLAGPNHGISVCGVFGSSTLVGIVARANTIYGPPDYELR